MEFRILGPLEVRTVEDAVAVPRGKARALLAMLTLHPGSVISTERLIDALWGEAPPPTARTALQGLVLELRRRLEPGRAKGERPSLLRTLSGGYRLDADPDDIDAERFRRLVDQAKDATVQERSSLLRDALRLWRGRALADFTYEPFAQREIAVLEDLRLQAIEDRVEADLALGLHREAVTELEFLIGEHPFRERLRELLMLGLYRSGRQADALEAYERARRTLSEELGVDPGPGLQALQRAILQQDPVLIGEAPGAAGTGPAPPSSQRWLPAERRIITTMVLDLSPRTQADAHDPEAIRPVLDRATSLATDIMKRLGATVEEGVGEVLVGSFGIPAAHGDDALRAVRAAVELRTALAALNDEDAHAVDLAFRAGLETGEVIVDDASGHRKVTGDALSTAARLQRAGANGEVLLGEVLARIVRAAATLERVEIPPVEVSEHAPRAYRLLDLARPTSAGRFESPIVGRTEELARIRAAYEDTVREGTAYRFTVLGDPGIGKSRLAAAFADTVDEGRVLTGHCPAYGEGITFWPMREIIQQAAGTTTDDAVHLLLERRTDGDAVASEVAAAIGLGKGPGRPDRLFPSFRRLFEVLTAEGPVVLILEDLHWGEQTLINLLGHLSETRAPLFILCLARPELIDEHPAWGIGRRNADTLYLEPLDPVETEELIVDRLAGATLSSEALTNIIGTAQGNPLFAEQMLAAFADEGRLHVPVSVQALLSSRLDRLGPGERDVLRCASVMGVDFDVRALTSLTPEQARPHLEQHLRALEHKRLITRTDHPGDRFRFRHVLIQLAAYRSMTRHDRARLHAHVADMLREEKAHRPAELDEILGYHLEQAAQHRHALGMTDDAESLAARSSEHLAAAARRAFGRFDMGAAVNLASRTTALVTSGPRRREMLRLLSETMPMLGRHVEADQALIELLGEAREENDPALVRALTLERVRIQLITGPDPVGLDEVRDEAERALEYFTAAGDHARAAQSCYVLGIAHMRRGEAGAAEEVSRLGLTHGVRSGLLREEAGPRAMLAHAIGEGETPVADAIRQCEELVPWLDTVHPIVLSVLAHLRAMAGELEAARDVIGRAREAIVERMRLRRPLVMAGRCAAAVEALGGDAEACERELQTALESARTFGERDEVSRIAAELARLTAAGGRPADAQEFATMSRDNAPAEGTAQALWRAAKARVLAERDPDDAEALATQALNLASPELLNLRGDLLLDLADVLRSSGDRERASEAIKQAIALYERKGNVVAAARARSLASSQG